MAQLDNRSILIMATDGFEQSELMVPLERLSKAGAKVSIAAPQTGEIRGWNGGDWGNTVEAELTIAEAEEGAFDALVLPGGQINPDILRMNADAIRLIQGFAKAGKPVAAICHAPWLLIEAGLVDNQAVTSWPSVRTDLENAGGAWADEAVIIDLPLITSRRPDDLEAFSDAIAAQLTPSNGHNPDIN